LLFRQAGPTDWSIPPFYVAIGAASETTRETIYVTAETYKRVRAVIARAGSSKTNGHDFVFAITEFNEESPLPTVYVPDEVVVRVLNDISSTFKAHRQTVPPMISEITQIFPRSK
jgi:hypothetical protein